MPKVKKYVLGQPCPNGHMLTNKTLGFRAKGSQSRCKICDAYKHRVYRNANKEKCYRKNQEWKALNGEKVKAYHAKTRLMTRFGIKEEDYEYMMKLQFGVCAICGKSEGSSKYPKLFVDHDHKTGLVRGLLCDLCNKGLGNFLDQPELLNSAAVYLVQPKNYPFFCTPHTDIAVKEANKPHMDES